MQPIGDFGGYPAPPGLGGPNSFGLPYTLNEMPLRQPKVKLAEKELIAKKAAIAGLEPTDYYTLKELSDIAQPLRGPNYDAERDYIEWEDGDSSDSDLEEDEEYTIDELVR